jgi:tetratricopeptide (TPR) repeat protein
VLGTASAGAPTPNAIRATPIVMPAAVFSTDPLRAPTGPESAPELRIATALVTRANRKMDEGDLACALSLYEQARDADPLAPEPYFFAGVAYHACSRFDEAVHRLRSSLFLDAAFWPASLYLALCYERMSRPSDALFEYERVAAAADEPFRFRAETSLGPDLQHWRQELVALARRRANSRL